MLNKKHNNVIIALQNTLQTEPQESTGLNVTGKERLQINKISKR